MRRLVCGILAATLLLCIAIPAPAARKYPPGPVYRNCPDTLAIFDVQQVDTLAAPCHPATHDTVLGVAGIITAFDAKPSGFAIHFESSQGGPWRGVQAYTGAYNYSASPYGLAIGDKIAVYGITQEFPSPGGTTEIDGPDSLPSTNDIVIRKISSGNALPPFQILSAYDLNRVPGTESPAPRQEQWEECLVRVRGPLKVARTSLQGGATAAGLPTNSFLVVRTLAPADSILIDGNTLTTLTPPVVGSVIDSVQGIVLQNTTSGVNSYRVAIRGSGDVFLTVPPNLSDCYPINDTFPAKPDGANQGSGSATTSNETLRLVFDRSVDVASAQNKNNYHLYSEFSGSTVDAATVEGGSGPIVLLSVTSVLGRGATEVIEAGSIGSANCPSCLMSGQNRMFINGVLSVADVQAPNPDSLTGACVDRSRFAGTGAGSGLRVTVRGIGTGIYGASQWLEDGVGGRRSGILVLAPSLPLTRGHQFLIAGQVQEFAGETELVTTVSVQDQGAAADPAPVSFTNNQVSVLTGTGCDAGQNFENGEDYEGVLVRLAGVRVPEHRTTGQSFYVADPSGTSGGDTILVSNLGGALDGYTPPDSGSTVDVTGVLHFTNGTYRICPRQANDIAVTQVGVAGGAPRRLALRAYPNPARRVRLSFTLPRGGDASLVVHDVLGRPVAVVAHGSFEPGTHSLEWNGRDSAGREVESGVYWYRLTVGSEIRTVQGVRLR
jgi:hypothetical protein